MKIGKLPEPVLIRSVLKQVKHRREEVLVGPAVGQDCAALEVGEDEVLVMSTDPITGTAKDLGHHSIHITANDLAAAGADPVGVMLTVMLPDTVEEPEIRKMLHDAEETCEKLHMEILGGQKNIVNVYAGFHRHNALVHLVLCISCPCSLFAVQCPPSAVSSEAGPETV